MYGGLDYLYRPVIAGMCKAEGLSDGTLTLLDIARMNDALTVKEENERRFSKALENKRGKR